MISLYKFESYHRIKKGRNLIQSPQHFDVRPAKPTRWRSQSLYIFTRSRSLPYRDTFGIVYPRYLRTRLLQKGPSSNYGLQSVYGPRKVTSHQECLETLLGPFRPAPEGFTHLFVAVDKFTKRIEVKPSPCISSGRAV